jgi:ribokinase
MTKFWDVAVAGDIFVDHILSGFERWPGPGEEHFTDEYVREAGGGAAITAAALARLGKNVAVFAMVGVQDEWLEERLNSFGVRLDALRRTATATAVSVSISTREDRTFFTWPGANAGLQQYLIEPETRLALTKARHVHFATPIARELAATLFPQLHAAGCTLSLDLGHHPEWLRDPRNWLTCAEVDFFLPNEKEAQIMAGNADPEQLLNALRSKGIENIVLKLGRMGAIATLHGKTYSAKPPSVNAVDTTGAGDAFDAGLIDAFLDQATPDEMLQRACICGSLSTRKSGALNALPNREELKEFYG